MATLIVQSSECTNLEGILNSSTFIVRYDTEISVENLKDHISQYSSIRNFGLHVQQKDHRLILLTDQELTKSTLTNKSSSVYEFFRWLITEKLIEGAFIDFLLTTPIQDSSQLGMAIQSISKKQVSVRLVSRFLAADLAPHHRRIVDIYLNNDRMKASINSRANSAHTRYERIRTVGKGAFGSAVLYRRRDDSSLVIIKEINMYDLDSSQRRLALNEVSLLSRIEHPNIIAYYDSFEEDGLLMIEMEYADGGTLAQMLSRTQTFIEETTITDMMIQMLSAVSYLHENSVLHRDLKTANIFLTKDAFVKIGDFGISKIMGTETLAQGAKTVVGTPYYISPEMCSGVAYNEKSDMWALGCILYEMCCLKKAFEGDNLPALVNNIMTCTYAPVKAPYSAEIKMVIRELLQLEPQKRPSASIALKMLRPSEHVRQRTASSSMRASATFSTLYELHTSSISLSSISRLPSRITIKQICLSESHALILTTDNDIYAWGNNTSGQLGIEGISKIENPKLVENLKGRDIHTIATGISFSVICCDRGTILTMGSSKYIGLGPDASDARKPVLIEQLLRENVKDVICGFEHTIAILESGEVYAWGSNECGQLGLPKVDHVYVPTKITLPSNKKAVNGKAGRDATMLLTDDGCLIAMGSNKHNKLNLTQRMGFFAKEKKDNSEYVSKPTILQGFPERVVDFSVGSYHTGVILESGQVMLFGRNDNGELGQGHCQKMAVRCLRPVKSLLHHACTQVLCGDGFTLVATTEQELYFWGRKESSRRKDDVGIFIEDLEQTVTEKKPLLRRATGEYLDSNVIMIPSLILRLQDQRRDKGICLSRIALAGKRVLVAVDSLEGKKLPSALSECSRRASDPIEADSMRTWLREELEQAEVIPMEQSKKTMHFRSDSSLLREIEELKKKIKEQDTTFEGHRMQMSDLQLKLQELQSRQAFLRKSEPPPEYERPSVSYNRLFPDRPTSSTCIIL
ncbi:unnamed protein product [Caenorhabditis bovis]|uniref:non-specific serine/threonine protein kinase n=1 Tax=Caenorhabditis bovis TaxID=2654633 RepID=A0A8S1F8D0_9PELO|nr:unnamed protein product [Caenorhabditis bovis]